MLCPIIWQALGTSILIRHKSSGIHFSRPATYFLDYTSFYFLCTILFLFYIYMLHDFICFLGGDLVISSVLVIFFDALLFLSDMSLYLYYLLSSFSFLFSSFSPFLFFFFFFFFCLCLL